MSYIGVAVGTVLGNFIYQAVTGRDWPLAIERSMFGLGAIFAVWLTSWCAA